MTATTTAPARVTPAELIGQQVITINHDGPITLVDIQEGAIETWSFGINPGVRTSFGYVAPADTPIPAKDPRVTVEKRTIAEARRAGHYGRGAWTYTIDGDEQQLIRWANTKAEALTKGARRLAIMDWHAANSTL